jgi:hypothetical protein
MSALFRKDLGPNLSRMINNDVKVTLSVLGIQHQIDVNRYLSGHFNLQKNSLLATGSVYPTACLF